MAHTNEEREQIFREKQHEYFMTDAENHVLDYLDSEGVQPELFEGTFDYDYLATVFEEKKDCNFSDNAIWNEIISEYIKANNIELHSPVPLQVFEVVMAVRGRYRISVPAKTHEEAKAKAEQAFSEADFGELEDIDADTVHTEDAQGRYQYY